MNNAPYAIQEAVRTFDALVGPSQVAFRRSGEEDEQAGRVGTVFSDDFFRRDDVAFGFTHLAAVEEDHALCQEAFERFDVVNEAGIIEDFHEETGIHEMQDSVFDAADILVDVHPVVGFLRIPGFSSLRASV